ncbi:MAG TPA: hypothetical protein VGF67_07965 [Ktedonobacteraceae bacterium]
MDNTRRSRLQPGAPIAAKGEWPGPCRQIAQKALSFQHGWSRVALLRAGRTGAVAVKGCWRRVTLHNDGDHAGHYHSLLDLAPEIAILFADAAQRALT